MKDPLSYIEDKFVIPQNFAYYKNHDGAYNKINFITGPNNSGKSQFLLSLSRAIYLSHCGLPIMIAEGVVTTFDNLFFYSNNYH